MTAVRFSPDSCSPGARMLLGIALGDSYGAPFENRSYRETSKKLTKDGLIPGRYTDDTEQALALAELIASGEPFHPRTLAQYLLHAYSRDPRPGYSLVTRNMLASPDPDSFLTSIPSEVRNKRKTDGAAMRALPIGFFPDKNQVIRNSIVSASITHGHPDAVAATIAIALISYEQIYCKAPLKKIWERVRDSIHEIHPDIIPYCDSCSHPGALDREIILEEHAGYGVPYTDSRIFLGAILALLARFGDDAYTLLTESIQMGGDTDTVAAIVIGAILIRGGDERIWDLIPGLENGPYGKDYLISTGDRISSRFLLKEGLD